MAFLLFPLLVLSALSAPLSRQQQYRVSVDAIIANSTRSDVFPGMVVASPSRANPDYYFDWVRDTALTMNSLVDYYAATADARVRILLFQWVDAEEHRQNQWAPSGLGEPKYEISGAAFTGPWGRP